METHWLQLLLGIHWHQVQWHYYVYWFCECQSSTTGGRMVSKWIVWGRAVSCLHNQAPNWNTIDSLWWNTLTSGTVTFLHVLILWVPELENWGTDGLQLNCVGRAVSCLHNQAPNWNTIDFLRWNTLTSGTVTLLRVLILWVPEQHNWRTDGLQMKLCEGEQSHAYIIKHPIETQLAPCDGIHWHQVQWHYYVYWFCECQSSTTGDGWSPNDCVRETSLMLT